MNNSDMPAMPLYINPEDFSLRWLKDIGTAKEGCIAGSNIGRGYRQIKYKGKRYLAHRIIFYFSYGYLPKTVDHIDGDTTNNHPINLRDVTNSQNMINRKHQSNNKSGHTGVDWMPRQKQWRAQIHKEGRKIYLGMSKDLQEAVNLRKDAEEIYHGEYSRK
jgi:hypothetical protein